MAITGGLNAFQLVFGPNPCIPGVLLHELSALEPVTTSKVLANHINSLSNISALQPHNSLFFCRMKHQKIFGDTAESGKKIGFAIENEDLIYFKRKEKTAGKDLAKLLLKMARLY